MQARRDFICNEIIRVARPFHESVMCAFFEAVAWEAKDRALSGVGLVDDGHGWVELPRDDALALVVAALSFNVAYRAQVLASDRVAPLADAFFAELPAQAKFFTNFDPPFHEFNALIHVSPKTHDSIDTGIVVEAAGELAAMLWVADGD